MVTAFNALHHSRRIASAAEQIAAVLKPGGFLGFVEPYVQNATQESAFGAPQSSIGISENIHTIEEWNQTFEAVGLSLTAFAVSDSFSAIYRTLEPDRAYRSELLKEDSDGCFVHYYQALLEVDRDGMEVSQGRSPVFQVRVTNNSGAAWASRGPKPVAIGYHVERANGAVPQMIAFDNPRTSIESFLAPGDSEVFNVPVHLPGPGNYRIEFDLVHETRSWFKDRGGQTAVVTYEVP